MHPRQLLIIGSAASILLGIVGLANEPAPEPPALKAARDHFRAESNAALAAVQKRYKERLQALKKDLSSQGDRKGAAAVKAELDRLDSPANVAKLIKGTWVVRYDNGVKRTYNIYEDGTVLFVENEMAGRIFPNGDDWLLDFSDGKLERLSIRPALWVEHYTEKGNYTEGKEADVIGAGNKTK